MLVNEEAWLDRVKDPDIVAALGEWAHTNALELEWHAWLSGRSGSAIARVRSMEKTRSREQILKLIPPGLGKLESRNVKLAKQLTPAPFYEMHIVPTTVSETLPGCSWYLHIQDIVGGNMSLWVPLANTMSDPALGDHCASIIKSIHTEWNDGRAPKHQGVKVHEYVRGAVADYLGPGRGLDLFAQEAEQDIEEPSPVVKIPGRDEHLPNPLTLLRPTNEKIEIWSGLGHGDLHVHNLLVPKTQATDPQSYKLIDLGRFADDAPLARDPMKLLGSVAAEWLPDLAPRTSLRRRLAELIVDPDATERTPPTVGYHEVSRRIHEASELFATTSGAGDVWPRQKLIALAVVALRLTSQPERFPSLADRWWFFEVAALATRALHLDNRTSGNHHDTAAEIRSVVADHQPEVDVPAAGRSEPTEAKIIPLRPRQRPDVVPELLVQLLQGIENLSATSSGERLADIGDGLRALATRLEHVLEDAEGTFEVKIELRAVRAQLIRMSNAVTAHKVLPDILHAGEELRRSADQRWIHGK